jgi:hypothetical protein
MTTPGMRLTWRCLASWVRAWETLQRRRVSSVRYQQESNHIAALPIEMIERESVPAALYAFLEILSSGSGNRPRKGEREGHRTTRMVVAAGNRLARLGAASYREHRWQQSRRRKLRQTVSAEPAHSSLEDAEAPHLSLF